MTPRRLVILIEADTDTCSECINLDWVRRGEVWCCLFPTEDEAATRLAFEGGSPARCRACLEAEAKP